MKAGDLVTLKMKKTQPPQVPRHAIVLNTWRNHKGKTLEVEILWPESLSARGRFRADLFEVISENK